MSMDMIPASRSYSPAALPIIEPPRSAAWHAAWDHLDALERLLRDDSIGADREALMESVLQLRYTLVHGL